MFIDIKNLPLVERQSWLQHAIAPRPIALASTADKDGNINLAPFSFFNLFSTEPPIVVFSPSRRMRDNTTKHTLENLLECMEVVINICDFDMAQQVSLASHEYPKNINEFTSAGFTMEPATMVRPPMVKESKIKLECMVTEIKELGGKGGAGNLVICEVLCMHVSDAILNEEQVMIDQQKIQHLARLGNDWYCKVDATNLFKIRKPGIQMGIGIHNLPASLRSSKLLSAGHLAQLATITEIPEGDFTFIPLETETAVCKLLDKHQENEAWQLLQMRTENDK